MPERAPGLPFWLGLAAVLIGVDQLSKFWVLANFYFGERVEITSFFNLVLVFNTGAAFSFLADAGGWQKWFFVIFALAVSAWLVQMLRQHVQGAHARERLLPLALTLVLAGALGNVIDRLRFGAVVDFLDFHVSGWHWPAFNVADSAIVIGVALLLWQQLTHKDLAGTAQ